MNNPCGERELHHPHAWGDLEWCPGGDVDEVVSESETWVEWGVLRSWGPQKGQVSLFERDRRTAEKCAKDWPGTLVCRSVIAEPWESA